MPCIGGMCRRKSVSYFTHNPNHRLVHGDAADDGEFTCDGCLVAGAGRRYRCSYPGCGFKLHEVCALRFPKTLKSIVHSQHRLRRCESAAGVQGGGRCEVCGEDVKGACTAAARAVAGSSCTRSASACRLWPRARSRCTPAATTRGSSSRRRRPTPVARPLRRRRARRAGVASGRGGTGAGRARWTCTRGASCQRRTSAVAARHRWRPWGRGAALGWWTP